MCRPPVLLVLGRDCRLAQPVTQSGGDFGTTPELPDRELRVVLGRTQAQISALQPEAAFVQAASRALDRDVLVGGGVREQQDSTETGLADAWPDAVDEGELPDRSIDRSFDHQLLDLEQNGLAPRAIQFDRLLLVEL